jgi:hypothetical protein
VELDEHLMAKERCTPGSPSLSLHLVLEVVAW